MKTFLAILIVFVFAGCVKDNYPGGRISPYFSIFDLKDLYKGNEVVLGPEVMFGSDKITGVVVSDHSGSNMPAGLLVLQDRRRLNELRGIAVNIGTDAATYKPGDSVSVAVTGGKLSRVDGIMQITGLTGQAVTKLATGITIPVNRVPSNLILANPEKYENTLVVLVKTGFNPLPQPGDKLSGDKILNDGFGDLNLHTESSASFSGTAAPFLANFYGIVFTRPGTDKTLVPNLRLRTGSDLVILSSTIDVSPVVITGFMSDVFGGDGNYEYVQFMATRDINFATTPFSMVITTNANAAVPTGFPSNGWATGNMRTYKMNMTTGTAAKGSYFYVGGSGKLINGANSTNISGANWIRSFNYTTTDGDGFGLKTGGLLANSGNASGIAVFAGTNVTVTSRPIDAIFIGTSGSLWTNTPTPQGYLIPNTDYYDVKNPITLEDQPYYRSGSNTLSFAYNTADLGIFNMLGGVYDPTLGRWAKARVQNNVLLTKASPLASIEGEGATLLK
jgi:hypothetical protein